jgi:glycosyltransferase involved in cell wall biosynthesis
MQAVEQARHRLGIAPDELQLLLGGKPGWLSEPILERARQTPGVRLLGPIDDQDLPTLYSLARATVYPSLYEGFGFPALESLACGTPAIVANTSSLPELVGDIGVMVEPTSIDSIAVGIEAVLTDERLAHDALQRGPTTAASFSWQAAAQQLEALYRQLTH